MERPNGRPGAEGLADRQRAVIEALRQRGGHAISDVCALLGGDGRYVLLMRAGPNAVPVLMHGVGEDEARDMLRQAYQDASGIVVAPVGSA